MNLGISGIGGASAIDVGVLASKLSLRNLFAVLDLVNLGVMGGKSFGLDASFAATTATFDSPAEDTELAFVESSPSPLLLSSRLLGEGDLDTSGEFHGAAIISEWGRVLASPMKARSAPSTGGIVFSNSKRVILGSTTSGVLMDTTEMFETAISGLFAALANGTGGAAELCFGLNLDATKPDFAG